MSETNIFSFSIGKEYLYLIADMCIKDYNRINSESLSEDYIKGLYRDIDNFVYGIEDTKLLSQYVCPPIIARFFKNTKSIKSLARRLDINIPVCNDWTDNFYDFYYYLLRYMIQAKDRIKHDKTTGKMHLCFSYEPKQPSDYNGIDDIKVSYDSILCKFYLLSYLKHTTHKKVSQGGCAYFVAFTYLLVITHLYLILSPLINDITEFLWHCFSILNPVVVGFTMTSRFDLGKVNAMSVIYELQQLNSMSPNLYIDTGSNNNSVTFIYSTLGKPFNHANDNDYKPLYITDNDGKRRVQMLVSGSGHTLTVRCDFVGLAIIFDLLGKAVDKDIFSFPANEFGQMLLSGKTIQYMLSYTDFREKRLESEKLSYQAKMLVDKFSLTKYQMDYVVIATTLAKLDKESISKRLSSLGTAQQSKIRKMVKAVQEYNIPELNCLHSINSKYSWGKQ